MKWHIFLLLIYSIALTLYVAIEVPKLKKFIKMNYDTAKMLDIELSRLYSYIRTNPIKE